jgi:hypothetical protein
MSDIGTHASRPEVMQNRAWSARHHNQYRVVRCYLQRTARGRLPDNYQKFILRGQCIPEPMVPEAIVEAVLFV